MDWDKNALEPTALSVKIGLGRAGLEIDGEAPRTPYNLVSAAIALLEEANQLAGDTALDDFYHRGPGITTEASVKAISELISLPFTEESPDSGMSERQVWVQLARDMVAWATANCNREELPELLHGFRFTEPVTAQLLMETLSHPMGEHTGALGTRVLDWDEKRFWLAVAEYIGPDHIDLMKKIAAFMSRVDDFR